MAKYIWRKINVWFGIESVRWTPASIAHRQAKTDLSFDDKTETIQDESSIGVLTDSRNSFIAKKRAEWEFSGHIEANGIWYLLYSLLGTVSSAVDTTWAYKHSFDLLESNQSPSLTIGEEDPVIWDIAFALAMIESLTISAEEWQIATFTVTWKSKPSASASLTSTFTVDNKLLARHSIFKTASNLAWLSWASAVCLKSFEITFTKNLEDDYCMGSQTPQDFINKQFTIEWSFTALFDATTFRVMQLAGTKQAISFELKDTTTTIGLSSNPRLTILLPLVSFEEFSRSMGNDEVVTQTISFKWLHSIADAESVEMELVNTKATYS